MMKKYFTALCLFSSLVFFNNCARNPVTGKKQVVLMSESQEIAMGREADPQIIQQFGLYEDSALQKYFNQKGQEIAKISHRSSLPFHFRILDSDVLNAFAVPGGYVYFTRQIMAHFNNEAQLAGVLGHEIGHIAARHSVAQQRNAILGQLGLIAGIVIAPDLARFAETASQGLGLLFLKFGRDDERQADELGAEYSSKLRYDARQMADFFVTLERKSAGASNELPEFLSTHPNPGDRNATVTQLAADWKKKLNLTNPLINRDAYLKRIEGIIYGEDPRGGYLENSIFYHPVLKFRFSSPSGWAYQNTPQRVQFAPKDGSALLFLTLGAGKTLQEAANNLLTQNNLQVIQSREVSVNGLRALSVIADPKPTQDGQQQQIRSLSYFIDYGGNIYQLTGVSALTNFNNYSPAFTQTMESFQILTDAAKINKKPQRVRLKTINQSITLDQALRNHRVASNRLEEFAVLNGMKLTDQLAPGSIIKVVEE